MWLNQYDLLAYNFEDLQSLDDLESGFSLFNSSSPPVFELPSPISDSSSLSANDPFDQNSFIDPWIISTTAFENTTPTAPCNSPSKENSPAIATPNLASSPGSSESNSAWDVVENDVGTKRPTTMRARKQHRSENSRAKVPACPKRQNAHNLIEKKYRNNLNSRIQALRDSIPSLRSPTKENEEGEDGMDGDATAESRKVQKCNKVIYIFPH